MIFNFRNTNFFLQQSKLKTNLISVTFFYIFCEFLMHALNLFKDNLSTYIFFPVYLRISSNFFVEIKSKISSYRFF